MVTLTSPRLIPTLRKSLCVLGSVSLRAFNKTTSQIKTRDRWVTSARAGPPPEPRASWGLPGRAGRSTEHLTCFPVSGGPPQCPAGCRFQAWHKSKPFRISQDIEILLVKFSFVTVIPPSLPHLPSLLHHNTYIHGSRLICLTIKMQSHKNQICSAKPAIYAR